MAKKSQDSTKGPPIEGPIPETTRKKGGTRRRTMTAEEKAFRTSDEWKEHMRSIGFKKGDGRGGRASGGGAIKTPKETKEWIASRSLDVAEFMYSMMTDENQPAKERIKAAAWLGEMSMSKAPVEQKMEVNHTHDIGAMLLEAQRLASKPLIDIKPTVIDVTPEPKGGTDNEDA